MELTCNSPGLLQNLRAFADYNPIEISANANRQLVTGLIPRRPLSRSVIFSFYLPEALAWGKIHNGGELRQLGLTFYGIVFTPVAVAAESTASRPRKGLRPVRELPLATRQSG